MVAARTRPGERAPAGTPLQRGRLAVLFTFAALGLLFAAWVPRIPEVKDRLALSPGALGVALLAPAIGSLIAMNVAGAVSARIGTRRTVGICVMIFCAAGWLPGLAGGYPELVALMLVWGLGLGGLDVSVNAQAVSVEKAYGRPLMSGFHAAWSLGSLVGAGIGTLGATEHWSIAGQQLILAVILAGLCALAGRFYLPDPLAESAAHDSTPRQRANRRGPLRLTDLSLVLVGTAGLCAMLSEGSVGDWSGILLRDSLHSSASHVGLGYAAFMATETLGRLFGDRIVLRLGRVRAVTTMAGIGAIGLALGFATQSVAGAIAGFALLGIGLSIIVPVSFSIAAEGRVHAGPAIAAVSTLSYTGFLVGPTGIGFLAQVTSVRAALWLIPALTALGAGLLVLAVRRLRRGEAVSSPLLGEVSP